MLFETVEMGAPKWVMTLFFGCLMYVAGCLAAFVML